MRGTLVWKEMREVKLSTPPHSYKQNTLPHSKRYLQRTKYIKIFNVGLRTTVIETGFRTPTSHRIKPLPPLSRLIHPIQETTPTQTVQPTPPVVRNYGMFKDELFKQKNTRSKPSFLPTTIP